MYRDITAEERNRRLCSKRESVVRRSVGLLAEHSTSIVALFFFFNRFDDRIEREKSGRRKKKGACWRRRRSTSREHDSGDIDVYFIAGIIRSPKRLHQRGNYCFRFETYLLRSIAYESRNRILAFHKKFCFVRVFPLRSLSLPAISTERIRSDRSLLVTGRGIGTLLSLCKFLFLTRIVPIQRKKS